MRGHRTRRVRTPKYTIMAAPAHSPMGRLLCRNAGTWRKHRPMATEMTVITESAVSDAAKLMNRPTCAEQL